MGENVDSLVLELLRVIRVDVGGIKDDVREVKSRLNSLEGGLAGVKRDQAAAYTDTVDQHLRYDRLTERLVRIQRRLEFQDENQDKLAHDRG